MFLKRMNAWGFVLALALFATVPLGLRAQAFTISRVQENAVDPVINKMGTKVAFRSSDANLPSANGFMQAYIKDLASETVTLVSKTSSGQPANNHVLSLGICDDGECIAFLTGATNFPGSNGLPQLYIHEFSLGTTQMASVNSAGQAASGGVSVIPTLTSLSMSADGRKVVFASNSSNLPGAGVGGQCYVRNITTGTTTVVTINSLGQPNTRPSGDPFISRNGRYVSFVGASDFFPGVSSSQCFVRDLNSNSVVMVSVSSGGTPSNGNCGQPTLSASGTLASFYTVGSNLGGVPGSIFLRDLSANTTTPLATTQGGQSVTTVQVHFLSPSSTHLMFTSNSSLLPQGSAGGQKYYMKNRITGEVTLMSRSEAGVAGAGTNKVYAPLSDDGSKVVFESDSSVLVPGDGNSATDIFLVGGPSSSLTPLTQQPPAMNGFVAKPTGIECCDEKQGNDLDAPKKFSGGETIQPHSGQEVRDETDLTLSGRDGQSSLSIMRRHMSRVNHVNSPFGPAWAFNLRQVFREQGSGDLEMESFGRKDIFEQVYINAWEGRGGRFERLVLDVPGGIATMRRSSGQEVIFHVEDTAQGYVGLMTELRSRNGNSIKIIYESAATQPNIALRKILRITESYGRDIFFHYEDTDYPGAVSRIADFSGSQWLYDYNASGQLLSVRTPTVTGTLGQNDFPSGRITKYGYLGGEAIPVERTLDFDDLDIFSTVMDGYTGLQPVGASFSSGNYVYTPDYMGYEFPAHSGNQYLIPSFEGNITINFSDPVSRAGAYVTGLSEVFLEAYDGNNQLLGTVSTGGENYVGAWTGIAPNFHLQIDVAGIRKIVIHDGGFGFTVDDVHFTGASTVPALVYNNLTSIIYPEQAASGLPRLSWTYIMDEQNAFFGFVQSHTVGHTGPGPLSAGGTYTYQYQRLTNPGVAIRTTCTDRRGTQTLMTFTGTGQLVGEEIRSQGLRPAQPAGYTRSFTYTGDGDMLTSTDEHGAATTRTLPPAATTPRLMQANEGEQVRFPNSHGAAQPFIKTQTIYEPIFNHPFKTVDPRGFEAGNDPADFTTTHICDYMEDLPAAKAYFAQKLWMTEAEIQALFDAAGIVDLGADVNGDGLRNQFHGNGIKIIHPTVTLPFWASLVGLGSTQEAFELWRFNEFGQEIFYQDEEGNVTLREYFSAADPDGFGAVDVPLAASLTGGYPKQVIGDALAQAGRNSGQNPAPVQATTLLQYGPQTSATGIFPGNMHGVPTAVVDPRGIKHLFLINELDEEVENVKAADVSASPEAGLTAFGYRQITIRNANGIPIEARIQNKDGLDGANDFIIHRFSYDILDQKREEILDFGFLAIKNTFGYDPSENLILETRGAGTPEASSQAWAYDERDIVVTNTKGVGTPEEAVFTTEIDEEGEITALIDAEGTNRTEFVLDGFQRRVNIINRKGQETRFAFDSASNPISVENHGPSDETASDFIMLSKTGTRFDERNRPFRVDAHIFHYPGRSVGTIDDGSLDPGDGLVSTISILDRKGRSVGQVDANENLSRNDFDGMDVAILLTDPSGNQVARFHDKNLNPVETREIEKADGLIVNPEVFITRKKFDALNRGFDLMEPNGQHTLLSHDSRNNAIRAKDALGNEKEFLVDRLGRSLGSRTYLSTNGLNASATNKDPAQGGGDGIITVGMAYDALHRNISQTDDKGQATRYGWDDLDRKVRTDYQDGTFETWAFNRDSELVGHRNQNGSVESYTNDPNGLPVALDVDNAPALANGHTVLGSTHKEWGRDGMDRPVVALDDNGPGEDVVCRYTHDSLSRGIRESQAIGARALLNVDCEWQGAGRRVSCTYPNGRKLSYGHDALDRLFEIKEASPTGALVVRFEHVGAWRDLRTTYGNGAILDKRNNARTQSVSTLAGDGAGYDANRRHLRHTWRLGATSTSPLITSYVNTYNGPFDSLTQSNLGTSRRVSENREHLAHADAYTFDSTYRMLGFSRQVGGAGGSGGTTPGGNTPGQGQNGNGQGNGPSKAKGQPFTNPGSVPGNPPPAGGGTTTLQSTRTLDGADSMLSFTDDGVAKNPIVDGFTNPDDNGMNQYSSFAGKAQAYDDNGALIDNGDLKLLFDHANRLVEVRRKSDNALIASYLYTADGRRVMKTLAAGAVTRYLRMGWQIIEERDASDAVLRQYVKGRSMDEAIQIKDHTQVGQPMYFFHSNSQGFIGALTNASGAMVEYYEYSQLGRRTIIDSNKTTILAASKVGNPVGFHGKGHDEETGLQYFEFRYYSPVTGQFISTDPLGWNGGLHGNLREAFGGDPWNRRDQMGLGDSQAVGPNNDLRCKEIEASASKIMQWTEDLISEINLIKNKIVDDPVYGVIKRFSVDVINYIDRTTPLDPYMMTGYNADLKDYAKAVEALDIYKANANDLNEASTFVEDERNLSDMVSEAEKLCCDEKIQEAVKNSRDYVSNQRGEFGIALREIGTLVWEVGALYDSAVRKIEEYKSSDK